MRGSRWSRIVVAAEGLGGTSAPAGATSVPGRFRALARRLAQKRLIVAAACAPPATYLLYVWHYAINAPFQDDWSLPALVGAAFNGRLTWSVLWKQHSEARLVVPNLFFVAFGYINHLNLKAVVFFNACIFVAAFFLMLMMFRSYTRRPLTFMRVLALGLVWFSLMGAENALWAFQLAWYLVLLFLLAMIYFLFVAPRNRKLALGLAVLAAVGASLSMVQGFLLWPVGLVCLLWVWRAEHKRYGEAAIWIAIGLFVTLLYARGYRSGGGCVPVGSDCSIRANAGHVSLLLKFFLTLVADAVPVRVFFPHLAVIQLHFVWVQLLGAALCVAAAYVVVRSFRERRDVTRVPLPMLLILFAVLFDLAIALGRAREGVSATLEGRFTMPSVLLLVGLVAYAGAHLPRPRALWRRRDSRGYRAAAASVLLGVLVLGQVAVGTIYGLRVARVERSFRTRAARTVVNFDLIRLSERGCYASVYVWNDVYSAPVALALVRVSGLVMLHNHLILYIPSTFREFRAQGLPPGGLARACLARRRSSVSN